MDNSFQTSFIPKKPLATERVVESRPLGIVTFFSIILVLGVLLATGGLFLYKNVLANQKDQLSKSLAISRDSFDSNTISQLDRFDKRIAVSKQILSTHVAFSPFFKALGDITIPTIQYTKFDNQFDKDLSVKMNGIARDYSSIAFQSQVFNSDKGRYFKNVVFSNLTLSDSGPTKGYVSFDISFTVDPSLLSYEKLASTARNAQPVITPTTPVQQPQPSTSTSTTQNPPQTPLETTPIPSL